VPVTIVAGLVAVKEGATIAQAEAEANALARGLGGFSQPAPR
jgi:hypothetical protein